jgi:uroporphyrinogen decarboxylase
MTMTSRERVERAIRFETPDRLPFNFWMDRGRMAEFDAKYGENFRINHYGADVWESMVFPAFPSGTFETRSNSSWMTEPAFEDWADAAKLPMPDPEDPALLAGLYADLKQFPDVAVIADMPNVLTTLEMMRSQEQLYIDMLMYPEQVTALCHRISDVGAALAEKVVKTEVSAVYVMDDFAFNRGLLLSLEQIKEMIVPHWKKIIDIANAADKPVFFHSDGDTSAAWPLLADELGVRMHNPIQPNLMDLAEFKRDYHGRMGCYGGIETGVIHQMTPAEIREHIFAMFEKCGKGGGLVASSHDIDYTTTDEQLDTMVAAIKECTY